MAKKITLVESIIKVGFDDKQAQRGLAKLKRQLKDKDKSEKVAARREATKQRKVESKQRKEKRFERDRRNRLKNSKQAELATQQRLVKLKQTEAKIAQATDKATQKRLKAEAKAQKDRISKEIKERKRQKKHERQRALAARRERLANAPRGGGRSALGFNTRGGFSVKGVGAAAVAAGAVNEGAKALQTSMTWENAMNALYTQEASKSPEGAGARTQEIANRVYKTAGAHNVANPEQLLKLFTELRPLTGEKGINDEVILGMVSTISQASKSMGLSGPMFERFLLGFRQFAANLNAGTASGQELGQMRDSSAALTNMLFEQMGLAGNITPDALAELMTSGQLTIADLLNSIPKLSASTQAGFDLYKNNSMQGAVDDLQAAYAHIQRTFGSGAMQGVTVFLKTMADTLEDNSALFKTAGVWTGELFGSMASGLKQLNDSWSSMSTEEQDKFTDKLETMAKVLGGSLAGAKIGGVFTALGALGGLSFAPLTAFLVALGGLVGYFGTETKFDNSEASSIQNLSEPQNAGRPISDLTAEDFGMFNTFWQALRNITIPEGVGGKLGESDVANILGNTTNNNNNSNQTIHNTTSFNGVTVHGDNGRTASKAIMQAVSPNN